MSKNLLGSGILGKELLCILCSIFLQFFRAYFVTLFVHTIRSLTTTHHVSDEQIKYENLINFKETGFANRICRMFTFKS